jgi:hypothetical protein
MPPGQNVSYPSSIDLASRRATLAAPAIPLLRIVLAAWAGLIYLAYWLGYLGVR